MRAIRSRRTGRTAVLARFAAAVVFLAAIGGLAAPMAAAHEDHTDADATETDPVTPAHEADAGPRTIVVIEVNGLIDPIMASYISRELAVADGRHAIGAVLQLNSTGTTLDDNELVELLDNVRLAHLPVGVWVGPSGAQALGGAAHLVTSVQFAAIAPGGRLGDFSSVGGLVHAHEPEPAQLHSHDSAGPHAGERSRRYEAAEAVTAGLTASTAPSVGEFILAMSDMGNIAPITQNLTNDDGLVQRAIAPDVAVSFVKLPLLDGLFHTAASPAVAYLLLLVALSMLLLDFYTGGVGVAAAVGAVCGLLAAFGLGTLDIRIWALVLLVGAFVAFAVDAQTGVPRFWTVAGGAALIIGSLGLFGQHSMSWIPLLVGIVLVGVFVLSGLPALIRTRYGTATVGREWMVGAEGTALTDIDPDGTVEVHGAQWRARVNRLTPLRAGESLRVSGLSGVVLEVEPIDGAAIDYREMRRKRADETVSETE
ncbi:NfeD family protein [Candidatus Poriferisodalis sp.]|uniref:NfeD family protein n=1 Tax=Candidatus Poriferisodalis sp. TaxID=3101277 RepID=UPI003D0DE466